MSSVVDEDGPIVGRPRVQRLLHKDRLRCRERYQRSAPPRRPRPRGALSVVPDGALLRSRLAVWEELASVLSSSGARIVLTESAAEAADLRHGRGESARPNERDRVIALATSGAAETLLDVSRRRPDDDDDDHDHGVRAIERADRATRRAARALSRDGDVALVTTTTDEDEDDRSSSSLLVLSSVEELLASLVDRGVLSTDERDRLTEACRAIDRDDAAAVAARSTGDRRRRYDTDAAVAAALRDGTLVRATLTARRRRGAVVVVGDVEHRVARPLRALPGDVVAVEPLPEAEWGPAAEGERRLSTNDDKEEHDDASRGDDVPRVPTARVAAVLEERGRRSVVATYRAPAPGSNGGGGDTFLVTPMDPRWPRVRISGRNRHQWADRRLLVRIDSWSSDEPHPRGHFVKVVGPVGDLETEIACLLLENEFDPIPFSARALACLPEEPWRIPEREIRARRDLRNLSNVEVYSVDPPGCQDIDDAMHARVLPDGSVEVGVHIADVTHFLPKGCALDKEAAEKSTTFYLEDRRFDMLPSLLSSDLCSLHGGTDRLAVSVVWTYEDDAFETLRSVWTGRTVVHNVAAMTYDQAHNVSRGAPPDPVPAPRVPPKTAGAPVDPARVPALRSSLALLTKLARTLRAARGRAGAIELDSPELSFEVDGDGRVSRVAAKTEKEIHRTVAELMISANRVAAERALARFPDVALLRVHDAKEKKEDEEEDDDDAATEEERRAKDAYAGSLAARALSEARYVCAGTPRADGSAGFFHYGLAVDAYTHFTSPIRRYADVVVHRLLLASLESPSPPENNQQRGSVRDGAPAVAIPGSDTISVLRGEGLTTKTRGRDTNHDDSVITTVADGPTIARAPPSSSSPHEYDVDEVRRVCDRANHQTRLAKISSRQCRSLFLSLYFRRAAETTVAVVVAVRSNGLLVHVPRYDLRSPVFLTDGARGHVHVDPRLLGSKATDGAPPSQEFGTSPCRRFPNGRLGIEGTDDDDDDATLRIVVPGAPRTLALRPTDVVRVRLSCDAADAYARVPPPRVDLVFDATTTTTTGISVASKDVSAPTARADADRASSPAADPPPATASSSSSTPTSLYRVAGSFAIVPVLEALDDDDAARDDAPPVRRTVPGRFAFGGFENPDDRSATRRTAVETAREQQRRERRRRGVGATEAASALDEYDANRRAEREITARTQRKAAEKRNARRAKSGR